MIARVMKKRSCRYAARKGHLDCLRFLFDKVEPSRDTEKDVVIQAACDGHVEILKYFVEERKISDAVKCMRGTTLQSMANSIASNT